MGGFTAAHPSSVMTQTAAPPTATSDERLVRTGALTRLLLRPDIGAFLGAVGVFLAFGYFASGGPVGVGEAVGRSMRTSLVAIVCVVLFASLALYGVNPNFNLTV